ncbi:MAG: bifunctional homocysteine S-methyltransferase/methylenetetrahydrofolate reductase [Spirochaetales bacterium]|nr:bifunctional homocysteine S-methyltransferase/methylenetetrahydrofolate reductase [Spirochaetales bacterium]
MNIKEYLQNNILLFEGAMGTYLSSLGRTYRKSPEEAVLDSPEQVAAIHREYLEAGARALKTDTFSANRLNYPESAAAIIEKACSIALKEAESYSAFVFADIGPIEFAEEKGDAATEFKWVADRFLENGVTNFLFETNSSLEGLETVAAYIKSRNPDSYIIVSFAILPDGFTRYGLFAKDLIEVVKRNVYIDSFGMNCVQGATHMKETLSKLDMGEKVISAMPNAGYPIVVGHRTRYDGDPSFFAQSVFDMARLGARILGGCCGTTPSHIRRVHELLSRQGVRVKERKRSESAGIIDRVVSPFWEKLMRGEKVIAVELDPPEIASMDRFMGGAWNLKSSGVDIITISDCPIARARMDSSLLSCKVNRELHMESLPHLTCRDRNLNATKALLLGLYAEGIRNVLLVTGDPIPTADRDEVKSVYQFNSRKLAAFVSALGQESLPSGFHIFGALNVNATNFDFQLKLAKEKIQNGMIGFLTQPVLSLEALENLKRAHEELDAFILGGMIPVVSEKNARFMDSEINGIRVSQRIIDEYRGKDRDECEKLAVEMTVHIAKEISPYVDGYYIITPFNRVSLMTQIVRNIKKL